MIYIMQRGDIVVVQADVKGQWPQRWYFASVVEHDQDTEDNWDVHKVQIVGEDFTRDDNAFGAIYRISDVAKHLAAKGLVTAQWGTVNPYASLNEIKAAILAAV